MFMTFANLGVGLTATKYVAEFRKTDPQRAGRIIAMSTAMAAVLGTAVGVVLVATSSWVALLLAAPHLRVGIAVSALALLVIVINDAQNGALAGLEAFKRRSTMQLIAAMMSFPVTVLAVYFYGLTGAVCGLIASESLLLVLNFRALRSETAAAAIPVRWRELRREVDVLLKFSVPVLCGSLVYVPAMWLTNMMMVKTPGGYSQMGIFSAADRWRTAIVFLPALLGGVTLPMLASLRGEAELRNYHNLLWNSVMLSVSASLAIAAPVAVAAPWIMASYGPAFREGTLVLVTLCAASVSFSAYWIVGQALISGGHVWIMFALNLGWASTLLTSAWVLRSHGAQGLALAYLVANTAQMTAALVCANRMRPAGGETLTTIPSEV
jgi:O-antigen/teichoic acid export membrane protein